MRLAHSAQLELGAVPIENIHTGAKSRDDIPAILLGLRHLCASPDLRRQVFELLEAEVAPAARKDIGRPGMDLWRILALGVPEQGLDCDFDRLEHTASHDGLVRRMMGHSPALGHACEQQTVTDSVSLLSPELLSKIGKLVVESGHKVAGKKPGEPFAGGPVHSAWRSTSTIRPMRAAVRTAARLADGLRLDGWRQHEHLSRRAEKRSDRVRTSRRNKSPPERYLSLRRHLAGRAEAMLAYELEAISAMRTGCSTRFRVGYSGTRPSRTARRCCRSSVRTPDTSPRARPASIRRSGCRCAWSRTGTSSSCTAGSCGAADRRGDGAVSRASRLQLRPRLPLAGEPGRARRAWAASSPDQRRLASEIEGFSGRR